MTKKIKDESEVYESAYDSMREIKLVYYKSTGKQWTRFKKSIKSMVNKMNKKKGVKTIKLKVLYDPETVKGTKTLMRALKKEDKSLKILWNTLEIVGKRLRKRGEPSYIVQPLFTAQSGIEKARNGIREAIGSLS